MRRIFKFDKIDFEGKGKVNSITVEMKYEEKKGRKLFSACGNVQNIYSGQCLDIIADYINDPIFNEILRLWKLYQRNDLHPECEHQRALGWVDEARKQVKIYHWYLNDEARKEKKAAEERALKSLKNGETFTPTDREVFYANLSTFCKTYTHQAPEYYGIETDFNTKKQKIEVKDLGSTRKTDHPEGLLCKPCPVCGYQYGSSWLYVPIPADDEAIIYKLLKEGSL